jgi:L-alanine-DL-glutamate epimerase-like enolase superfamily enzyme
MSNSKMKISKISVYQVDLPMKEGSYSWSNQSFEAFDSTVVIVETNSGLKGVGEACPLGPAYLPAYAEGVRRGVAQIAPGLMGENPIEIDKINRRMDALLMGHPYVKSAIDMACWDLFGKAVGEPVYNLLGGLQQEKVKLFKVVSRQDAGAMAEKIRDYQAQGFKQFQMKVGAGADADIERILKVSAELKPGNVLAADANTGWRQHEAIRVVKAVRDVDIYIEQPCLSYEECLAVRRHTDHPIILDECMDSIHTLMRGFQDSAMDVVNLKINRIGGLTASRLFRDLCIKMGITMTIEDSWGGDIATAAIAHLAHSTPSEFHFQSSAFHEYTNLEIALGGPIIKDGYMSVTDRPGLGVEANMEALGDAVFVSS